MLTRWEPFREMARMFEDPLFRVWTADASEPRWSPAVDVYEDEREFVVQADLPGVDPKDVSIDVKDQVLTVQGSRKFDREGRQECCHRVERAYGAFSRTFTLPSTVASDKVDAEYRNGVLIVHLPKREEAKPRKIEVKVS
jgi:HSP20 family protein